MADITSLPVMTANDAASIGFARFNNVPTQPLDIPDGDFTISARTSDGRRVTFYFGAWRRGGPPSVVTIQYHDAGTHVRNAEGGQSPSFDMLVSGMGGHPILDTRTLSAGDKPTLATILLGKPGMTS